MPTKTRPAAIPMPMLTAEALADLDVGTSREWLETDGRGGYAMGTVVACPTRRYHGWLVAPIPGSGKRHVFLGRFDEVVATPQGERGIACALWPSAVAPRGHEVQTGFDQAPHPVFTYEVDGLTIRREILMVKGRHGVLVRYSLEGGGSAGVELRLRPLLACREADALTFENAELDTAVAKLTDGIACRPYAGLPAVSITWSAGATELERGSTWYRKQQYPADAARGYAAEEDQWSPCLLRMPLRKGAAVVLAVTVGEPIADPRGAFDRELAARRKALPATSSAASAQAAAAKAASQAAVRVALAADDFLFTTDAGRRTVCAGYPWFGEWGRDTFLSLPGLTLARGQLGACADVLSGAIPYLRGGLLPNVYGPTPEQSDYGSVDAALWFARAVFAYAEAGGDKVRVAEEYLPALVAIADGYAAGIERLGISITKDGLLQAGGPHLNPTWMDAQTAAGPVTPRDGCAVELNALWYQLLCGVAELLQKRKDKVRSKAFTERAKQHKKAFLARFWLAKDKRLADRVTAAGPDRCIRPNMVLAAALPGSPLAKAQRKAVVDCATQHLLTPRGLRTLAPADPAYIGRYEGGPAERDAAYHQGTAWPWLLGFYVEARLRAESPTRKLCAELRALWDAFVPELDASGLGHVSEVFDGDAPQRPGGTIAQAWNTAEWLRSLAMLTQAESGRA